METKITKQVIVDAIRAYHKKTGKRPTCKGSKKQLGFVESTVSLKFGSWNNAILAAGLEPYRTGRRVTVQCFSCGKPITRPLCRTKKSSRHYCGTECSNRGRAKPGRCKSCGKEGVRGEYCQECAWENLRLPDDTTIQGLIDRRNENARVATAIRSMARRTMSRNGIEKKCIVCGYDLFVDCCHIRPIADFPLDSLVAEVNSPENMVYLCPNHHKEFDAGLIRIEEYKSG